MKSSKILPGVFSVVGILVLVFAFQNCGQSGSVAGVAVSEKSSGNSDPIAVVPVVDPPSGSTGGAYDNNDDGSSDDSACIAKCANVKVMSVTLAADVISNASRGNFALMAPVDALVIKQGLNKIRVKALADDKNVSQLKIILDLSKSFILDADNKQHGIFVPSGEQSGLKLNLASKIEVKKDLMYEIEFEIAFESQLVGGGKACKFKPVIHNARIL